MLCACATACGSVCDCACHGFTSPAVAGAMGLRLARLHDRARDMKVRAGLRPYTVTIVRARAVGLKARGDGPTEIVAEWPILPTPKIGDLTGLSEALGADQLREQGTIMLSEVSLTYSEDVLLGRGDSGNPIPAGEVVFYEVRHIDGTGRVTQRRRFVPSSAPASDTSAGQWTIMLTRAPWDRDRSGTLR